MPLQEKYLPLQSKNKEGAIAQLVEQRTENPCVPGSIPGGTTEKTDSEKGQSFLCLYDQRKSQTAQSTHRQQKKKATRNGWLFFLKNAN